MISQKKKADRVKNVFKKSTALGQSFEGTANIETPMSRHYKHPHQLKVHRCQACRHEFCSH